MKKYRPSNGTEGMGFIDEYCSNCIHDNPDQEAKSPRCEILTLTFCLDVNDKDYPEEWTYNDQNEPICTKFKKWDWGNDGDPNDPDNPLAPVNISPNQMCLPFIIMEIEQSILDAYNKPDLRIYA